VCVYYCRTYYKAVLRAIQLRLSKGASGVLLFTTWDSVAGSGRTPIPGNISGHTRLLPGCPCRQSAAQPLQTTALARQMPTGADVAAVRLNVAAPAGQPVAEGSALALRLQLQDQLQNVLNVSGPVTMRRTLSSVRDSAR